MPAILALPPAIVCQVASIHDGDTVTCRSGQKVRIAVIDANELDGTCHGACAKQPAREARDTLVRMIGGRVDEARSIRRARDVRTEHLVLSNAPVVRFRIVGRSGKRLVGENRAVRCAMVSAGAAVEGVRWLKRYKLAPCRKRLERASDYEMREAA